MSTQRAHLLLFYRLTSDFSDRSDNSDNSDLSELSGLSDLSDPSDLSELSDPSELSDLSEISYSENSSLTVFPKYADSFSASSVLGTNLLFSIAKIVCRLTPIALASSA